MRKNKRKSQAETQRMSIVKKKADFLWFFSLFLKQKMMFNRVCWGRFVFLPLELYQLLLQALKRFCALDLCRDFDANLSEWFDYIIPSLILVLMMLAEPVAFGLGHKNAFLICAIIDDGKKTILRFCFINEKWAVWAGECIVYKNKAVVSV